MGNHQAKGGIESRPPDRQRLQPQRALRCEVTRPGAKGMR